ncbi:hypothetical protein XENTR_v10012103 [Xenopus tropicalis]|nr:hypothetical protein XENTR_v10012103 [Xenopus tropicalis]
MRHRNKNMTFNRNPLPSTNRGPQKHHIASLGILAHQVEWDPIPLMLALFLMKPLGKYRHYNTAKIFLTFTASRCKEQVMLYSRY